jgi:hypothetical protein
MSIILYGLAECDLPRYEVRESWFLQIALTCGLPGEIKFPIARLLKARKNV